MINIFVIILFLSLILLSCARVGSPTGGPKDEKPPIMVSAEPDFGTTNFKSKKIKIHFDEFVKFKDLNKQLITSPPLKYQPEITPLGIASKTITIKLKDTLKTNTTYTFNFGNAIIDNAEGNVLEQFKYVFSTGDFIDSLQIKGRVSYSMSLDKPKNILVMLYNMDSTYTDSVIYRKKPNYVTNTLDTTLFSITNIKQGKYRLIALEDRNSNMTYEPHSDKIGYINAPISIPTDSSFNLNIFRETLPFGIKKILENGKDKLLIAYEGKWNADIQRIYQEKRDSIPFIKYAPKNRDSVDVWYKNTIADSIFVKIKSKIDSTYKVRLRTKKKDSLDIKPLISQTLNPRDSLIFESNTPIERIIKEHIEIINKDSIAIAFEASTYKNPLSVLLDFKREPENSYNITVLPDAFCDFYGRTNDSIQLKLNTRKPEDYGEIIFTVKTNKLTIVELLTEQDKVIETNYINQTTELKYPELLPGKYKLRCMIDDNTNNRWDTGNFLEHRQPERVIYFDGIIELRANWTDNESITID